MAGCSGFPWLLFILMYSEVFIRASQCITPNAAEVENEVWPVSAGLAQVLHLFSVDPPTCHHVGPNVKPSGLAVESHCSGQAAGMCPLCPPMCCLPASMLFAGTMGVLGRKEVVCIDKRKWTNTLFIHASSSSSSSSSPIKGYCCYYCLEIEAVSWVMKQTEENTNGDLFCLLVVASTRKAHHPLPSLPLSHETSTAKSIVISQCGWLVCSGGMSLATTG